MSNQNLLDPSPSPLMLCQTGFQDMRQWGQLKPQENAAIEVTIFAHVDSALINPATAGHWLRKVSHYQFKWAMSHVHPEETPKVYAMPTEAIPGGITFKKIGLSVKRKYVRENWNFYDVESAVWLECEHLPQTVPVMADYFYYAWQLCLTDMDAQYAMHSAGSGVTFPSVVPDFTNLDKDKEASEAWAYVATFTDVIVPETTGHPAMLYLPNTRLDPVLVPVGKLYSAILARIEGDTVLGKAHPITPLKIAFNRASDGRLTALSVIE